MTKISRITKFHISSGRMPRVHIQRGLAVLALAALCGCSGPATGAAPGTAQKDAPKAGQKQEQMNEEQQTLYALGAALANNLRELELTPSDREFVLAGFEEVTTGQTPRVDVAAFMQKIQMLHQQRQARTIAQRREQGAAYLEQQATQSGAVKTPSGMVYREVSAGTGRAVAEHDTVTVHYEGSLPDGTVADSSRKRGKPNEFRVNGVIACWKEALLKMKVGGKSHIVCPPDLAYGDGGSPPVIPPGATLTFDIELVKLSKPTDTGG